MLQKINKTVCANKRNKKFINEFSFHKTALLFHKYEKKNKYDY